MPRGSDTRAVGGDAGVEVFSQVLEEEHGRAPQLALAVHGDQAANVGGGVIRVRVEVGEGVDGGPGVLVVAREVAELDVGEEARAVDGGLGVGVVAGEDGGAVWYASDSILVNCVFAGNQAASEGGAIYGGVGSATNCKRNRRRQVAICAPFWTSPRSWGLSCSTRACKR